MHERFKYKDKNEILRKASELGYVLPFSDDISSLFSPVIIGNKTIQNRIVVQPMEGYDSESDGAPSELSRRRYLRYAAGGNGMIWMEAVSVTHEGRSNPRQLWLNRNNADRYLQLNSEIRQEAGKAGVDPCLVIQLTHSGRYSKPDGISRPLVAAPNPVLDKSVPEQISDSELKTLQDHYVSAARLALRAGFDAIDLKACHGYLMIELLAAKNRNDSIYGGEASSARFRFFLETIDRIRNEVPGILVTTRLNISDRYKGGFGVKQDEEPDFSEPLLLVSELSKRGISLLNISMGSPYFNPHVTRPYDTPVPGQNLPEEHPLEGVMKMLTGTALFQKKFPEIYIIGSAYSYLRQYAPNVGAAVIRNGETSFVGFGRGSFAYPDLPLDLLRTGKADPSKVCITCSGCTRLVRNLLPGGCVIRDREIYGEELKKLIKDGK